jgi:hypothetical protein
MASDTDISFLLDEARLGGAKVVMVGDDRQLGAVDVGGAMGALIERHGGAVHALTENVRQHDAVERAALAQLRAGDVGRAVKLVRSGWRTDVSKGLYHSSHVSSPGERGATTPGRRHGGPRAGGGAGAPGAQGREPASQPGVKRGATGERAVRASRVLGPCLGSEQCREQGMLMGVNGRPDDVDRRLDLIPQVLGKVRPGRVAPNVETKIPPYPPQVAPTRLGIDGDLLVGSRDALECLVIPRRL